MSLADPYVMLQDVCDREFGFRPLNFSIKPVHVANGLARALTQRTYKTDALAHTLRRYVVKQQLGIDQERHPNKEILEKYGTAFEALQGSVPDRQRLNSLRALLLDVLGADGAVFDQEDKSSYTLANERFVTRDPSDQRSGMFLARLLQAEHGETTAAACLSALLASESDAWTTLALPLLQFGAVREEIIQSAAGRRTAMADHLFSHTDGRLDSPTLAVLRESYDRLARFEAVAASKLNSLRRFVLFGCFVLHVHAISRWHDRNPERPRPPMLFDMFDGKVKSVRDASRATLRAAGDAIEFLILDCFKDKVQVIATSEEELLIALRDQGASDTVIRDFRNNAAGESEEPVYALARALVDAAFAKAREHPIGSLVELGRRAGFLSPWANSGRGGKLKKRYTATAEFIETLVAATVDPEEPLEFPEFLSRLKSDFGIVLGRPEDDRLIRRNNMLSSQFGPPTSINEEDLRRNVTKLRFLLVETGYGKSYADGRTIVTTEPAVLK